MDERNNVILFVGLLIMFIAIIGMVVLFIAGELHEHGRTSETETFTVNDPSSDRSCGLNYAPDDSLIVQYYNGTAWTTLTTADYTISGNTLTVKNSAMD